MMMTRLLLILAPLPALAHDGPAGHAHPHGAEGAALALLLLAAGLAAWGVLRGRK